MLEVEPVAVELGDAGRGGHDAMRIPKLDDVESLEKGAQHRRRQTVVRRRVEREQVDGRRGLGAREGAARVGGVRGDGEREELCHFGEARDEIWGENVEGERLEDGG